jgi:hypothetical protein
VFQARDAARCPLGLPPVAIGNDQRDGARVPCQENVRERHRVLRGIEEERAALGHEVLREIEGAIALTVQEDLAIPENTKREGAGRRRLPGLAVMHHEEDPRREIER